MATIKHSLNKQSQHFQQQKVDLGHLALLTQRNEGKTDVGVHFSVVTLLVPQRPMLT
jgi:hypothetical protein